MTPDRFGALILATAVIGAFGLLSDLGLGAAIVRKGGDDHAREDLDSAFTVQLLVGTFAAAVVLAARHPLERLVWGGMAGSGILGVIVAASLLATPFRTGAITRLERNLSFGRIALIETVEHLVYCAVMVAILVKGGGVAALTAALVVRTGAGAAMGLAISGWSPRASRNLRRAKALLRFGLSYQAAAALFVLNGLMIPLLIGRVGGATVLGQVVWAGANAERLRPLLDNVMRVAFPSYARLQGDPAALTRALERTLHGAFVASCTYCSLFAGTAPLTVLFLFTKTWVSAVPLLYVLLAVFPFVAAAGFMESVLFAQGRASLVRNIHVAKLALLAALVVPGTARYGILGYGVAYSVSVLFLVTADLWALRHIFPARALLLALRGPLIGGVVAAGVARIGMVQLAGRLHPLLALTAVCTAALAAMTVVLLVVDRARLRATVTAVARRDG